MSMLVYESAKSGGDLERKAAKGQSDKRIYNVLCDNGEGGSEVTSAALAESPLAIVTPECRLIRVAAHPKILAPMNSRGVGSYEVTIDYAEEDEEKSQERPEPGTWHYSIDTGSASQKVYTSIERVSSGGPDYGKSIGWDGKSAKGVDASVAAPEFSITAYYKPTAITPNFFASICAKAYHTNDATWLGFAAGELLLVGVSGNGDIPTVRGQRVKPVPLVFKFLYSKNLTGIVLDDTFTVASKKGWDYLDVYYHTVIDGDYSVPRVKGYAVHRIYEAIDFAETFGFGGN